MPIRPVIRVTRVPLVKRSNTAAQRVGNPVARILHRHLELTVRLIGLRGRRR